MSWYPSHTEPEERDPRLIIASLDHTARRLGIPSAGVLGAVFARWEELVGVDVAAHSRPRSLRAGVLTIEVDEPAWATQLRYLSNEVLGRLREAAGPDGVDELQIRVAGSGGERTGRRGGPRTRPDSPL